MKKKYKILICSMICFVLCFGMTITSYAGFYTSWGGDLDTDFDIDSTYASSYPYFSSSYLSTYALSNALPNDFTGVNQGLFQSSAYSLNGYFTDLANPTDFYTSSSTSVDVSGLPLVLCGRRGSGSNANALVWHRIESGAFVAIVDNWLCSTEPFSVYSIYNRNGFNDASTLNSFCIKTDVDTAGTNNYYWFNLSTFFINGIVNASDFALMFTDFPIYMSTTSGDSGFSVYTDFSFLADNINYNYLLLDEIVNDPQAPEYVNPWWEESKNYLNFRVSSVYGWESTTKAFTHNMNFSWNKDMMMNSDFYVLNLSYFITYKDDSMAAPETFYYVTDGYKFTRRLMDIAWLTTSGTLKNKISFVLPLNEFRDSNGESLLSYYLNTIHRVVGTNTDQIDINDFWTGTWQKLEEWSTFLTGEQFTQNNYKLTYVSPVIGGHIDVFNITGYVQIGRIADINDISIENIPQDYYSGLNVSHYDMLTAKNSVIDRSNEVNLYPPEEGQTPSEIKDETNNNGTTISGGTHATAQGGNANVTINTADNPFKNWSPEAVESLKETWDTIKDELDAHKNNSFMALMVESYKIIPDALWEVIILCGSVISIFAVVRFIRNR